MGSVHRNACSGNCVQPFKLPGTPNYPDAKKRARGRIAVPTRIVRATDRTFTAAELAAWFAVDDPADEPTPTPAAATPAAVTRPAYGRSRARSILRAEPGDDRSAALMSAVNFAALGGMSADEFEAIARLNPTGCVSKYLNGTDRLRQEVERAYAKARSGYGYR